MSIVEPVSVLRNSIASWDDEMEDSVYLLVSSSIKNEVSLGSVLKFSFELLVFSFFWTRLPKLNTTLG